MNAFARYAALALTTVTLQAIAEEAADAEEAGPWSGNIAIGYLEVSGNVENTSFTLNSELNYDRNRWHHTLVGQALGRSEDDETTAEAYKASYKGKFDITDRNYAYGLVDYNKNRFSGYDHQLYENVGLGRRFIVTKRHELNAEAGVGATQSKLSRPEVPAPDDEDRSQNEFTYRVAADYKWNISENATFIQTVSAISGSSNTYVETLTQLKTGIVGNAFMVLGYSIKRNSDVEEGRDKKDTYTSISLEYQF